MSARIFGVLKGSPAYKAGLRRGETVLKINGREINDYLDYMYQSCGEKLEIELSDRNVTVYNPDYLPLGLEFESLLIDKPKSCRNKCIFCFIDQLPPNMRESCYFKDDDYRLSFLQGNYVTLTNLSDGELDRIIEYNIPRINVSVHTTNPELRKKMLNNKFAGKIMSQLERLSESGISMNCQIVLCRDINDGAELEKTLNDLFGLNESIESVSVVPVGLSGYRDGLFKLRAFDKKSSGELIEMCERLQKKYLDKCGRNFVYLADEFYIMAEKEIPVPEEYDGFPQIENGVGLCSSLKDEFEEALEHKKAEPKTKKSIATGVLAYDFICELIAMLKTDKISVYKIKNGFFGENITVSGLLTGGDLISQLKDRELGDELIITKSMLRHDEDIFLDNLTVGDVEKALGVKIIAVENDGFELLDVLCG